MNANRRANIWTTGVILVVVSLIVALGVCSCGALWTMVGATGGAAAGAAVAGPAGAAAGAPLGAAAGKQFDDNSQLRSGEIVGEEALARQNAELRAMVAALRGDVDQIAADRDAIAREGVWAWAKRWLVRLLIFAVVVCALGWLAWNWTKLAAFARGREARKRFGWIKGLVAADGIKHTREPRAEADQPTAPRMRMSSAD